MIKDEGELSIENADEMNVPVNIFISAPQDTGLHKWTLSADNFMPRKSRCSIDAYYVIADSRDELEQLVQKHIEPLYRDAYKNILVKSSNYYWEFEK